MSGYNNRPKKQFYNRPNYGYSNEMPQSRPPLPNPPWQVANPWLANQESQLQCFENGFDNFIPCAPEPPNVNYNNKNNLQNETGTVQHQTPINNQQINNENVKAVPPLYNNAHFSSNNVYRNNNMVSYPIPAKYQDTGGNSGKTVESSNKTLKHSSDTRSASNNRCPSDSRFPSSNNRSRNYKPSHYKHNSRDNTSRSSQDSSYHRRSKSAESRSLPRSRTHSSSPNRKSKNRSNCNSNRNSSSRGSSTKTSSSETSSSHRHGQEKTPSLPPSKPVTAKMPEKLPKKLNKDTILKLVNSTTRYEPAMQKLLREQRSKLTQNLRNKYKDTNKDSMAANSVYADEEITDGIIPNFTLNLTEDLQFLQEALDNVDEKEAQDAAKLETKIDNDCDKISPNEDKNSADLILLDEWSATDEKDTEELISYNNYDLGPLELPSNIDELQLPSDVSSFFNFTEINKDETTSLLNGGGEEDQDFFNTVKINESIGNTECNESSIDTTKLSPIKSVLDSAVLSLADDSPEIKQQINDQNENLISEICKENFNDENFCTSFKTSETVKNDVYLSPYHTNSLETSENDKQKIYIKENIQNKNPENYMSPFKNEKQNNQNENIDDYASTFRKDEENNQNKNFENCVPSIKNEETTPHENVDYVLPFNNGEDNMSNENCTQENYVDKKDNIQNHIKSENLVLSLDKIDENGKLVSSFPEERVAATSLKAEELIISKEKEKTPLKTNKANVPTENQINPKTSLINENIRSSKKFRRKLTNEKRVLTKKRNNSTSAIKKTRKEPVKPIRIKLIKENNSLKKNLNYFRQIIRAEILNTTSANPYKQQKAPKNQSDNISEQVIENNIRNNSKINLKTSHITYKKILSNAKSEDLQNIDSNSTKSDTCLSRKFDVINMENSSQKKNDTVNSEKSISTPTYIKSKNLDTSSALLENSEIISSQSTTDNTATSKDKLTNEDDVSSDNNAENIRLSVSSNENFGSRKWRSPGEKKFISASSSTTKRPLSSAVSSTNAKEEILLKIYDIDVQIQRLMDDKMNLYKQLMAHSEECQENINMKKSVVRKLDLGTELKIDTTGLSLLAVSERVPTNGNPITVNQKSLNVANDLEETLESNSPLISNEIGNVHSEINSDMKQISKRNKHSDSKTKNVNRNSDKENLSKRKTKKTQQENVDKGNSKNVIGSIEHSEKGEINKSQKLIEKDDKIESKKSPLSHVDEFLEKTELQKNVEKEIQSKKSSKKSRRERSSSKKSSSKDKHSKETIRNDEFEGNKTSVIIDHTVTKRSIKASSVTPNSDIEDKSVKSHSNRENETLKTKNSKRKRDQRYETIYSDSNSESENISVKINSKNIRFESPDTETRKINSKRKRNQENDNDSKSSIKRHSNKKLKKKYILSDSEGESGFEHRHSTPINEVETTRTRRCSIDSSQKSVEHEFSAVKMNFINSIIKPCTVQLVRVNPEKYLKNIEVKEEIETVILDSKTSENETLEVKITDSRLNENSIKTSNESSPRITPIMDEDKQQKSNEGSESQASSTSTECSNNNINYNDLECSTKKLDCFKCSDHTGSILFVKIYKHAIIAGGEDGKIYKYNVDNGELLGSVNAHHAAITSFFITNNKDAITCIYSGSLDTYFKGFEIETLKEITNIHLETSIQCMDADWGYVFIGTVSGHLYRYSINNNSMEDEKRQIGEEAILALKTQNEGARRILISAPRNELISIRDAMSGLLLRYITFTTSNYTIYSIMLSQHGSMIYCGTNKKTILGYNFSDGLLTKELVAGKGIVCLLEYKKLLFAGCYDGFIYVFDIITNQLVTKFVGPGGMILALDVLDNKVIIGSKNSYLEIRSMPENVLKYINENRR